MAATQEVNPGRKPWRRDPQSSVSPWHVPLLCACPWWAPQTTDTVDERIISVGSGSNEKEAQSGVEEFGSSGLGSWQGWFFLFKLIYRGEPKLLTPKIPVDRYLKVEASEPPLKTTFAHL